MLFAYLMGCIGLGMDSISIMWGPWALGMAATDAKLNARFERAGLQALKPELGLDMLEAAFKSNIIEPIAASLLLRRIQQDYISDFGDITMLLQDGPKSPVSASKVLLHLLY